MNSVLVKVGGAALLVFACMSVVSVASVNQWDLGEVTQDGLKTLIALGLGYIALHLKPAQVLGVVLIAFTLAGASEAQAGPLSRWFGARGCRSCVARSVAKPVHPQANTAPKYRVECRGVACRRVEVR